MERKSSGLSNPSRRSTLKALIGAGGAAAIFVPAWNETLEAQTVSCVQAAPALTEGPYWVDEKLFRADIRTDPTTGSVREGLPLTMVINLQNLSSGSCTPLAGAFVDIWHCDAKGVYSDVSQAYNPGGGTGTVNTAGQKFLRGYQIADASGQVSFTTIYPGWYTGRTIHIHVRVRTYDGTRILTNFVSQIFFDEEVNNLVLGQTLYSRTSSRDTTNARDNIYGNNTRLLAATAGSASEGYTATITLGATFNTAAASAPSIATGGVANAVSGAAGAAPGAWVSIFGTGLAAATTTVAASDLSNSTLPTTLGGVSVKINGKAAFLQYVSASQVNVLAPGDSNRGTVSVELTNANGTSTTSTNLLAVLPGLSTLSNYVRAVRSDGAIVNGTGAAEAGFQTSAAAGQGDVVSLYGTGFGAVDNGPAEGLVFSGAYPASNPVTVTIGGVAAEVLWAGLVGPGLYQINARVPASLSDGDHAVVAYVSGSSSQAGALLKVAASAKLSAVLAGTRRLLARLGPITPAGAPHARVEWLAALGALDPQDGPAGCLVQLA
ncbi:MAG: hypothetical protein R2729_09775 [Bryobacteraceae bacterium]